MSFAFAMLFTLVASAAETPPSSAAPGAQARFAQSYMQLIETADAFELDAALVARERLLEHHGGTIERVGASERLTALMALGEPFSTRRVDWWQGRMPEKDERYVVVWWHPDQTDSRRVVLGAQNVATRHGVPVLAVIPDGTTADRKSAADVIAICPKVTFAAAPARLLKVIDPEDLPQITVVEAEVVLWQGRWDDLDGTPLRP